MNSAHNSSSCDDSNCKFCRSVESSLEDSSSQMKDNKQDLYRNKNESHQFPVNKPDLCRNLVSTCNQSLSTYQSSLHRNQQTGEISNTLQSSQTLYHQSSQNKVNACKQKKLSFLEIQSIGNLQPTDMPETEFSLSQNIRSHCKKQPNKTSDLNPSAVESSETFYSTSQRVKAKKQFIINRDPTIQETRGQTNLKKLSSSQNLCPLPQQFSESNMNRIQGIDEENQQQSRNAQTVFKSLHPFSPQTHQSALNCASCTVACDSFENESGNNRVQNTGSNLQYYLRKCEAQGLHSVTILQMEVSAHEKSEGRLSPTQSSSPGKTLAYECSKLQIQSSKSQEFPQYEDRESCFQRSPSQRLQQPERDAKEMDLIFKIDSVVDEQPSATKAVSTKESITNLNFCTEQHTESGISEAQGFPQFTQVFNASRSTEHPSSYSLPQQQQSKQESSQETKHSIHRTSCIQSSKPQQFEHIKKDLLSEQRSTAVQPSEKLHSPRQGNILQHLAYALSGQQSMPRPSQRLQHSKDRPSCIPIPIPKRLEQSNSDGKAKQNSQVVQSAEKSLSPKQFNFLQPSSYPLSQQQQSTQTSSPGLQQSTAITSCNQSSKPQLLEQIEKDLIAKQRSTAVQPSEKSHSPRQGKFLRPSAYPLSEQQFMQRPSQRLQHSKGRPSCIPILIPKRLEQSYSDGKAKQNSQVIQSAEKSLSPSQFNVLQPSPCPLSEQQSMQRLQHSKGRPSGMPIPITKRFEKSKSGAKAKQNSQNLTPAKNSPIPNQFNVLQPSSYSLSQKTSSPGLQQSTYTTSCIQSTITQQHKQSKRNSKVEQRSQEEKPTVKTPNQNIVLQRDIWDDNKLIFSGPDVPSWVLIFQRDCYPRENLLDRFLRMCANQNIPSCQTEAQQHFDLNILKHPYANSSESVNLLVYGPTTWTTLLIKTFSRGNHFPFVPPCVHALTKKIIRCGILTTVSVFQVKSLSESIGVIKDCCLSAKTTFMFAFSVAYQNAEAHIERIRRWVNRDIPIAFIVCRCKSVGDKVAESLKTGYKLKAKYDLIACSLCKVDSEEEVDAVFYNAMDVSRRITM